MGGYGTRVGRRENAEHIMTTGTRYKLIAYVVFGVFLIAISVIFLSSRLSNTNVLSKSEKYAMLNAKDLKKRIEDTGSFAICDNALVVHHIPLDDKSASVWYTFIDFDDGTNNDVAWYKEDEFFCTYDTQSISNEIIYNDIKKHDGRIKCSLVYLTIKNYGQSEDVDLHYVDKKKVMDAIR